MPLSYLFTFSTMSACYLFKKVQNIFKKASSLQKKSNIIEDEHKDRY